MAGKRLETFTDRHEAIALFEYLRGRDPNKPWPLLPILVFPALGGSGKSTLIEYLRTKKCCLPDGRAVIPYAHIDFTQSDAPKSLLDILVTLRNLLQQERDERGRYLTFPRFDLGASIVLAAPTEGSPSLLNVEEEVQSILTSGSHLVESLTDIGGAVADIADLIPAPLDSISKVIRALLAGLKLTAQIPAVKELLQRLESGPGWRWYQVSTNDPGLQAHADIRHLLRRLQILSTPGNPDRDYLIKEVLPAAFVADLLDALVVSDPPRAWSKTANVALFLDGFEVLLESTKTSDTASRTSDTASRLLEALTLTEHRARGGTDPFLLVIGSRPSSLLEFANIRQQASLEEQTEVQTEQSIGERVRKLYTAWREKLPGDTSNLRLGDLFLPLLLHDFGQEDTRRYLSQLGKGKYLQTFADKKRVEAIHRVTHGHPLSLALAAAAFLRANDRGRDLNVDRFVEEAVSAKVVPGHELESIDAYLLDLFLRQLSATERNELIFCAAPRFLDARLVRVILQLSTDREAQDRWEPYQRLTFVDAADNKRLVFHPIVRLLLLRRLPPSHEPESDYYRTHARLRDYFRTLAARGDEQARIEEAYHALALGDPEPAIETGIDAQRVNPALWERLVEAVVQAPTELRPADIEQQVEYKRPHHNLQDSVRAIILYSWLLTTVQSIPEKAALLYRNMGRVYCDLQGGDQQANLQRAIESYKSALVIYTREEFPAEWATTQLDLGEAYSLLRGKDRQATKQMALDCYQAALQVCTEQTLPVEWARAQNNLGEALSDVPGANQQANLRQAIIHYRAALRIRTQAQFPFEWAITQNNMGNSYAHLLEGDRKANLREAIACYQAALSEHIREKYPVEWARAQNNLGNAYRNLAGSLEQEDQKEERQENLEQAIACYQAAFQVRTQQHYPVEWAATQHNLGLAYSRLSGKDEQEQQEDFEKAVACYRAALQVYTQEAYPMDWARTQNALGNAYRYKPEKDEDKQRANLQRAVDYFKTTLQIYTREGFPEAWARTQYNLGLTYAHMLAKEKKDRQANLQQAIVGYNAALEVFTREAYPTDWAKTQSALGNAYRFLPLGNQERNLQTAIDHYERAEDGYHSIHNDDEAQKVRTYQGMTRSKLAKLRRF